MKSKIIAIFIFLLSFACKAQFITCDTIIHKKAYDSYYNESDLCPVIVTFKIYKAGGDCSRDGDIFKNDIPNLKTATPKDYSHSGYDQGHMADSKDFAYDCDLQESTFRFYNCVPQTAALNRSNWKHYETQIRKMSRTDSLLVICYNHFSGKKLNGRVSIPDTCYKLVYSLSMRKLVFSIGITNDVDNVETKPSPKLVARIEEAIKWTSK